MYFISLLNHTALHNSLYFLLSKIGFFPDQSSDQVFQENRTVHSQNDSWQISFFKYALHLKSNLEVNIFCSFAGLIGGGQPWCTCSLKCAPGQIKLNKNCNWAPLLPGCLNTYCSVLTWWVTNQHYGASLGGGGIYGGGGIIGGVSGLVGGGSERLGPSGGIVSLIGGIVTVPVSVIRGESRVVGGSTW